MLFEDFVKKSEEPGKEEVKTLKKSYEQSITAEQFKSIKPETLIKYNGASYTVKDNDGIIMSIKDESGKEFKISLGVFNSSCAII